MNWTEWAANFAFLGMPPLSCAWAWWLWIRDSRNTPAPQWRRAATLIGLMAFTLSIAVGAFALFYWHYSPGRGPAPPDPTRIGTMAGFGLAVFGVPFCVLAKSWTRFSLILCALGLLGFYFGMFVAS
jgi:hypothetical protein